MLQQLIEPLVKHVNNIPHRVHDGACFQNVNLNGVSTEAIWKVPDLLIRYFR